MTAPVRKVVSLIPFKALFTWSAEELVNMRTTAGRFPAKKLGDILRRVKEPIKVQNDIEYRRVTVRIKGNGVCLRDEVMGKNIGTKRQFVAREGQLIISRIDARNGAFGIVPKDLDGAIVTSDFLLFDVVKADIQYVLCVLSSAKSQPYWQSRSTGTTNRQRVDENSFLNTSIPMPAGAVQRALVSAYQSAMIAAKILAEDSLSIIDKMDVMIFEPLGIDQNKVQVAKRKHSYDFLKFASLRILAKWGVESNCISVSPQSMFLTTKFECVSLSQVAVINPIVHIPEHLPNSEVTFLPMECISDIYGEISEYRIGMTTKVKGYTRFAEGDVLWAKITPCMQNGKSAVANNLTNGYGYGSTEYHVIRVNPEKVSASYIHCLLRTKLLRQAAQSYFSGSAGQQRVSSAFLENLCIPIPPLGIQMQIVAKVVELREQLRSFRQQAVSLQQQAYLQFENEVFG